MASFFGSPKVSNNAPVVSSLRLHTSCYGKPIPLLYGKPRVAVNVVQYDDFQAHAHRERAAGGKGGSAPSTTSYTYTAAIILALGQGPILAVPRVWRGKEIHQPGNIGLDVYTGNDGQAPFPHFANKYPAKALSYPGIAYLASAAYELGSNAALENHNAEVETAFRVSAQIPDADPSAVITDLVTHPIRGLRLSEGALADLGPFWAFCRANGLWVSPAYTEQRPARELIQQLIDIGYADAVYSENRLKIVPYSDMAAEGNGASYQPSRSPVYVLTEDDFIAEGAEPPVRVSRKHASEVYNHAQVKFFDRANDYNEQVAEDKDAADIDVRGLRSMPVIEAKEICSAEVAARLANFKVRRAIGVRNTYRFALSWKHVLLEPTDIVLVTLPAYQFDRVPMMITTIEEDDEGRLTFEAEDYPMKATGAVQVPTPGTDSYVPDFSVEPGNANIPVLFEPPYALTDNRPELWLATAGGDNWGGAEVWVSLDNASYKRVGRIEGPSRHGSLSAPLRAGAAIDTAQLLQVDMSASRGQLLAATQEDALSLVTMCYVDGEYLAYAHAGLTGVNTYDLGYLVRGAHGSDNAAHRAGGPFVRLDAAVFRYPYPKEWLGKTVWIKLVSFNRFGSGQQLLAEVPAYSRVLEGATLPAVSGLRFERPWIGMEAKVAWEPLDGADSYDVQVLAGSPVAPVRESVALQATRYTYGAGDMASDGGPWRTVVLRVRGRAATGRTGQWAQLLATNPQVGPLQGIQLDGGVRAAYFRCATPADGDFAGILVWIDTTPNFPANATSLAYDGPGTFATLTRLGDGTELKGGVTYYVRAAGYDTFGKDMLSISPAVAVDVVSLELDPGSITREMLKDGILDVAKFAEGLAPVGIVDALPAPGGYSGPVVVFNQADGKLHRYTGGTWVKEVPTSDLTGKITAQQLAADSVVAGTIAAGAVSARELAAGAVTTSKLAVGNFDNIIPDAEFSDKAWWGVGDGYEVISHAGSPSHSPSWNSRHSLRIKRSGAARAASHFFPCEMGATYRIRLQVFLSADFSGRFSAILHVPWVAYHTMGVTPTGVWTSGEPIMFEGSSPKGEVQSFEAIFTNPSSGARDNSRFQFILRSELAAGYAEIGGMSIVRVGDSTLIQDGAVTTQKLTASSVTADKLAANSVTADKLVVNSIAGDKLVANSITGRELAAGSISAEHLLVGGSANMLVNPGYESDWFGWEVHEPHPTQRGFNLAKPWYVENTSTKTLWMRNADPIDSTQYGAFIVQFVAIEPGATYMASAYTGAHRCKIQVHINYMNEQGQFLVPGLTVSDAINDFAMVGGAGLADYKRCWFRSKAPPTARKAVFYILKYGTYGGHGDSYAFATRPYMGEVLPYQTVVPPWDAAGSSIIGPGQVKTERLSAITANLGDITGGSLNINNRFIVSHNGDVLIRSATGGARMEQTSQLLQVFGHNGVLRTRFGIW